MTKLYERECIPVPRIFASSQDHKNGFLFYENPLRISRKMELEDQDKNRLCITSYWCKCIVGLVSMWEVELLQPPPTIQTFFPANHSSFTTKTRSYKEYMLLMP
jgi:hypothetical protein